MRNQRTGWTSSLRFLSATNKTQNRDSKTIGIPKQWFICSNQSDKCMSLTCFCLCIGRRSLNVHATATLTWGIRAEALAAHWNAER